MNGSASGLVGTDTLMRQNSGTVNVLATKMYEERLKLPLQRDSPDDQSIKVLIQTIKLFPLRWLSSLVCIGLILLIICYFFLQRYGDNVGQVMDPNHAPMLKSAPNPGQPLGYAHFA